jgi:predicted dinucleotide-binding enzyme
VIKVLNTIPSKALMAAGCPAGSRDRVALPISGDNTKAKEIVAQLIDRIGSKPLKGDRPFRSPSSIPRQFAF